MEIMNNNTQLPSLLYDTIYKCNFHYIKFKMVQGRNWSGPLSNGERFSSLFGVVKSVAAAVLCYQGNEYGVARCLSARTQCLALAEIHLRKLVRKENPEFLIASERGRERQTVTSRLTCFCHRWCFDHGIRCPS